ncbi:flagellar motor switch protein FliN [Armatimonadetes bacterium Uphvl-Ar1]|nr:flagellar motor switch protein FliN [Armatimonadetes bacterium Uphvl-Ar1]
MAQLSPELVSKFSNLQSNIWQNVSLAVSEAAGVGINFSDAMTIASEISDLYGEMSSPKLIIQFAFANNPESNQVVLISQDTLVDIFNTVTGKSVDAVDENTISEIRDAIEAIVQGLCLAAGNIRNEAMVASGLSVRLQIFSVPNNMQSAGQVLRTNLRISGEDLSGSLIWLVDEETASIFTNTESSSAARPGFSVEGGGSKATGSSGSLSGLEDSGLDLLYDIPLEVSVELGRVRMVVKDVIELGSGSIVEIDKAAGEPVDVMVNGRLVAHGEVVVIEDNFGVRITEILSPAERMAKLNEVA